MIKRNIQIVLLAIRLSANFSPAFGQTTSDKIIFLTENYTTYIEKVNLDDENRDSIYKEIIQNSIFEKHFQKSEYVEKTGFVDLIVERKDLREKLGSLLSILLKKNSAINSSENETSEDSRALTKAAS